MALGWVSPRPSQFLGHGNSALEGASLSTPQFMQSASFRPQQVGISKERGEDPFSKTPLGTKGKVLWSGAKATSRRRCGHSSLLLVHLGTKEAPAPGGCPTAAADPKAGFPLGDAQL